MKARPSTKQKLKSDKSKFILALNIIGGVAPLSEILKIKRQTIYAWLSPKRIRPIPEALYCEAIEKATKGQVTKEELRPDIFNEIKEFPSPEQSLKKGISLIRQAFNELHGEK
jgi:DNA-binding transcriptional regulator YdaS (Cro superfamily)